MFSSNPAKLIANGDEEREASQMSKMETEQDIGTKRRAIHDSGVLAEVSDVNKNKNNNKKVTRVVEVLDATLDTFEETLQTQRKNNDDYVADDIVKLNNGSLHAKGKSKSKKKRQKKTKTEKADEKKQKKLKLDKEKTIMEDDEASTKKSKTNKSHGRFLSLFCCCFKV